jgi:hypothetical protein
VDWDSKVESTCNKIQSIMCHINDGSMLGEILQINLKWTQQHAGLSTPILEKSYIQSNWFTQIREFLQAITDKNTTNLVA